MNLDPDSILLMQEIAKMTVADGGTVIVINEGLKLTMHRGDGAIEQMISWLDLRFAAMGAVDLVKANLAYMRSQLENRA